MIGAIIGDIVGSRFEYRNHRSKKFELFDIRCQPTDDSIMSLAVAQAIMECEGNCDQLSQTAIKHMQLLGRQYYNAGYGRNFIKWIFANDPQPYNSYGNGAAMRVGPCGYAAKSLEEAKELSAKVTCVSHNHPEGMKGAEAVATAIYLARSGKSKDEIKSFIQENYYEIDYTLDQIRDEYKFFETCQGTVPVALEAFFEAKGFEDAIRNAISVGGDSDTVAAITGSVAEAYFGVPEEIIINAIKKLDRFETEILSRFEQAFPSKSANDNDQTEQSIYDVIKRAEMIPKEIIQQTTDAVFSQEAEIVDASEYEYQEDIMLHYDQIPDAAAPLLKEAKALVSKIEKALSSAPAVINAMRAAVPEINLQAVLTDQQKQQLADGVLKLMTKKDGSLLATLINPETKEIVANVPLESVKMTPQMSHAMMNLSTQMQMIRIAEQIQKVQKTVEEVRVSLEGDRLATAYSCQQRLLQAMEIRNPVLREAALMQLASSAEDSRNLLMLSQKNNVEYIMSQPEGFLQKILADTKPGEIPKKMEEVRESFEVTPKS